MLPGYQERQRGDKGKRAQQSRYPAGHTPLCGRRLRVCRAFPLPGAGVHARGCVLSAIQPRVQLVNRLAALFGVYLHTPEQGALLFRSYVNSERHRRSQLVGEQPVQRLGRHTAGQAEIYSGREGVDVCPGTLSHALVLLYRGVALLESHGHGAVRTPGRLPRAAEVQQAHRALLQHKVVGAYIAVDQPGLVHGAERGEQRLYQREKLRGRYPAAPPGGEVYEVGSLDVLHDYVRRIVGLKVVAHHHYLRLLFHARHRPGLEEEAAQPLLIAGIAPAHAGVHVHRRGGVPSREAGGEVFLYRDLHLEAQVAAYIGYAEAALAEGAADQVAVHQHGSRRQMVRSRRV